jgi:hypothetical protein
MEVGLPSFTGTIVSATLYLNVEDYTDDGSRGSAFLGIQANPVSLTGNAYNDGYSQLNNLQGVQDIVDPGVGLDGFDVTTGIENDYQDGSSFAAFGLTYSGDRNGNSNLDFDPGTSFLEIITTSATPEPSSLLMVGIGAACMLARLRRRT